LYRSSTGEVSRRLLGLSKFLLQRALGGLKLFHLISEAVLGRITAQFHIGAVCAILQPGLGQLHRVCLGTDRLLDTTDVILQLSDLLFSLLIKDEIKAYDKLLKKFIVTYQ